MNEAGCTFSQEDVDDIAAGEESATIERYGKIDGFAEVHATLTDIFDGCETTPRAALTEEAARDVDSHLAALRPAPEGGRGSDTTSRP